MVPTQLTSRSWPHRVMRMSGTAEVVGAICYTFGGARHPCQEVEPQSYRQLGQNMIHLLLSCGRRRLAVTRRVPSPTRGHRQCPLSQTTGNVGQCSRSS